MRLRELVTRTSIFAGLVCLAASTAFYHAWFFVFFFGLSGIVAVSYRASRAIIVMRLREARRVLWIPLLLCLVMLAPFLTIYLPSLRLGTERNWENTIDYLPHPSSYLWLGPEHFLWGSLRFNYESWRRIRDRESSRIRRCRHQSGVRRVGLGASGMVFALFEEEISHRAHGRIGCQPCLSARSS